ncbi:MAG: hypothetical protein JNL78_12655 [Rhodocyclaceae bacterium]|jgi:hypothetical protein|nr:hypothetical protein [Rhodocyclaceae bacterium]
MEIRWTGLLAALAAVAAAGNAAAQPSAAAREGTKLTISLTATVRTTGRFVDGRNATTTSAVNRVLKGKCRLEAGAVGAYGLEGPSRQQEKAMKRKDPGMANLEKEHARCKGNQDCLMALAQKMAEQDFQPKAPQAEGAVQVWYPQSCSGSLSADDLFTADIKDGPGLSYQSRSTVTGSALIPEGGEKGWLAVYIEHDLAGNSTLYRFNEAEPVPLEKHTVRTGYQAGTTRNKVPVGLTQRVDTKPWGPVKGPPQSGAVTRNIEGGTLTLEWQIQR